jgi:hypothetical protein
MVSKVMIPAPIRTGAALGDCATKDAEENTRHRTVQRVREDFIEFFLPKECVSRQVEIITGSSASYSSSKMLESCSQHTHSSDLFGSLPHRS